MVMSTHAHTHTQEYICTCTHTHMHTLSRENVSRHEIPFKKKKIFVFRKWGKTNLFELETRKGSKNKESSKTVNGRKTEKSLLRRSKKEVRQNNCKKLQSYG